MKTYDADLKVVESYRRRALQWAAPPKFYTRTVQRRSPGFVPAAAAEDEELDRSTKITAVDFSGETPLKYATPIFRNHTLKREIGMPKGRGVPLYIYRWREEATLLG